MFVQLHRTDCKNIQMVNMYGTPCFSEPFKFFTCFIKSIKWVIELATTEDLQQHYVF